MSNAHIPLDRLKDNPHQSRVDVGDTKGLAVTILDHGLQSVPPGRLVDEEGELAKDDGMPITMAPSAELEKHPEWAVQLAAGHRRKEAVRMLMDLYETEGALNGKVVTRQRLQRAGVRPGKMPVEVKALTDEDMLDVLTIENAQRKELSPIEQARLIGDLDAAGRSNQEIAERFGKSPSWVSNRKRLTELPRRVQEAVHDGDLSVRQAQALQGIGPTCEEDRRAAQILQSAPSWARDYLSAEGIIERALNEDLDSDTLRSRVDDLQGLLTETAATMERFVRPVLRLPEEQMQTLRSAYRAAPDTGEFDGHVFVNGEKAVPISWGSHPDGEGGRAASTSLYELVDPEEFKRRGVPPSSPYWWGEEANVAGTTYRLGWKADVFTATGEMDDIEIDLVQQKTDQGTQSDDDQRNGEEAKTDHDGDDVGAPQEDAAGAGHGRPGEVVSGHDEDLQGGQAGDSAEERDGEEGSADRAVSGDGALAEADVHVTDTGGEPGALGQVIAEVESQSWLWEVGREVDGGYHATVWVYDGRERTGSYSETEAGTPRSALHAAYNAAKEAQKGSPDVGHVDQAEVSALLSSSDPDTMRDTDAAECASIASLYVAYVVADKRMERWRREEIAQEMRSRQETVTEDDFPDAVWAKAQAEIRSRLEPQEA